ncbi:MAG: AmmeMemoRadiSam system protein A [Bacteroidia bacterium]|nr:AmmeMemoRadiSam system protein A [Caldisericia bacterium]NCC47231.1 AmmeMemoRadiSam system protein A [Bacteroidia bacterium]
MNEYEQKTLLRVARTTIENHLDNRQFNILLERKQFPSLWVKKGCFVTLTQNQRLRGCIGTIEPIFPLLDAVQRNSMSAAFYDPRFHPVTHKEIQTIRIEISVLTIPRELMYANPHEIVEKVNPYQDGVILQLGSHTATFLPQVWEELPTHEEFFRHLSFKAGLEPNSWKNNSDMKIFIYQVDKFAET